MYFTCKDTTKFRDNQTIPFNCITKISFFLQVSINILTLAPMNPANLWPEGQVSGFCFIFFFLAKFGFLNLVRKDTQNLQNDKTFSLKSRKVMQTIQDFCFIYNYTIIYIYFT